MGENGAKALRSFARLRSLIDLDTARKSRLENIRYLWEIIESIGRSIKLNKRSFQLRIKKYSFYSSKRAKVYMLKKSSSLTETMNQHYKWVAESLDSLIYPIREPHVSFSFQLKDNIATNDPSFGEMRLFSQTKQWFIDSQKTFPSFFSIHYPFTLSIVQLKMM